MRQFLFALLIALLPLRGWVGDAMALTMAAGNGSTLANATHVGSTSHPSGCHEDATPAGTTDAAEHGHCNTCDVCNGPAMVWAYTGSHSTTLPHRHRPPTGTRFASSEREPSLKPPIS